MKNLVLVMGAFFCFLSMESFAQIKLIKDPVGILLGYEDAAGTIYNNSSTPMVSTLDSVTVVVPMGDTLAVYNPVTKEFRYSTGGLIFRLNESNQVLNSSEEVIGWIDTSGHVYGADSLMKAAAAGIAPFKLAYYFFFVNR